MDKKLYRIRSVECAAVAWVSHYVKLARQAVLNVRLLSAFLS